jgi:hypothetical protein
MSRSWKKTPIVANSKFSSGRKVKQSAQRRLRRTVRERVARGEYNLPTLREVSRAVGGKHYIHNWGETPAYKLVGK